MTPGDRSAFIQRRKFPRRLPNRIATDIAFELQREGWRVADDGVRAVFSGEHRTYLTAGHDRGSGDGAALVLAIETKLIERGQR